MLLNVLAGYDRLDIASVEHPAEDYVAALGQPVSGFRIGIARALFFDLLDADVAHVIDDALRVLAKLTRSMADTMLPPTRDITVGAETYAYHEELFGRMSGRYMIPTHRALQSGGNAKPPITCGADGVSSCSGARSTMRFGTLISWCCRRAAGRREKSMRRSSGKRPTFRGTRSSRTPGRSTSTASRRFPCGAGLRQAVSPSD